MQILKKILNVLIDILVIVLLAVSIVVTMLALTSKSEGFPNLLGYSPVSVQSDSMVPAFDKGDLIIDKVVTPGTTFAVGDVITFRTEIDGNVVFNTHRIAEIKTTEGVKMYITRGDNAPDVDPEPVMEIDIVAKYEGTCFKGWGTPYDFLTSQMGFFLVVLLPLILFFLYQVFRVIRNLIEYNKEKALDEAAHAAAAINAKANGLTEEQMREALESYIAKQNAQLSTQENVQEQEKEPAVKKEEISN
ncbi:MAG: signal peptidase I [Acutalibacteraceae bacterium]